jgi:hypothetical protein
VAAGDFGFSTLIQAFDVLISTVAVIVLFAAAYLVTKG